MNSVQRNLWKVVFAAAVLLFTAMWAKAAPPAQVGCPNCTLCGTGYTQGQPCPCIGNGSVCGDGRCYVVGLQRSNRPPQAPPVMAVRASKPAQAPPVTVTTYAAAPAVAVAGPFTTRATRALRVGGSSFGYPVTTAGTIYTLAPGTAPRGTIRCTSAGCYIQR